MASSPNRPVERVPLSRIRRQPTHRTTRWRTPRGSAAPRTWIGTSRLSASGYRPHVRRLYRVFFRHSSLRDRSHVAVWRTPVRRILPPRILCPTFRQISRRPKCLVVFSCVPPVVRVSSDIHRTGRRIPQDNRAAKQWPNTPSSGSRCGGTTWRSHDRLRPAHGTYRPVSFRLSDDCSL